MNWVYAPILPGNDDWAVSYAFPAGGGNGAALAIPTVHWTAGSENRAFQFLNSIDSGATVHFGGWINYPGPTTGQPPWINLCRCDSSGIINWYFPVFTSGGQFGGWQFVDTLFVLSDTPPPGQNHCLALSAGQSNFSGLPTWFDGIFLDVVSSTSLCATSSHRISKPFPNPATDKLWVDMPEAPASITAIDAGGRTHDLKNFNHRDSTLELDVNTLPAGICLLRITTAKGVNVIRFVKA